MHILPKSDQVDIMLLLEGTFPYVSGGVSSWVNQIIRGFPSYRFGAVFIGSKRSDYSVLKYPLPENLVHLETWFMHDPQAKPEIVPLEGDRVAFKAVRHLHEWFKNPDQSQLNEAQIRLERLLDPEKGIDLRQFLYSRRAWDYITETYDQRCSDPSFVDYFWTIRNMHTPIWLLADIARQLIPARLYHTVSTGYAGFLGALLHHKTGRPLILSEHGIYTKERRIDIFQNDWIQDNRNALQKDPTQVGYYRDLWIRFFETLGRLCYGAASTIVSLFEGARSREIADGAPPERTTVIPNGIDITRYAPLRKTQPATPPLVLTLLGRVVPIKDIKTFIRALRIVASHLPQVEGWIIGPEDEDRDYAKECKSLAESLAIDRQIQFKGFQDPLTIFPKTGVVVLSSVSEGLPLVILEAFASGLPVVATDVGACRQLIFGHGSEDESIGPAGAVVGINNPQALAEEMLKLLQDPAYWNRARQAAMTRVDRTYAHQRMFERYSELYQTGVR